MCEKLLLLLFRLPEEQLKQRVNGQGGIRLKHEAVGNP
jgi:hypothetical protein